jgi:hypothetical protein
LRRAAIEGLEWIVVDDAPGGSPGVTSFIEATRASWTSCPIRLVVAGTQHRAKAANAGLSVATGALIHFFDDDDTIAPDFYAKTLAFLAANPRFRAVATLSESVLERPMSDGSFQELSRSPHYPETRVVSLAELAVVQTIAPVSVVAHRDCIVAIGGFDERFAVCEDYELYLRFLTRFDIGILPEILCAFHNRQIGTAFPESWMNSPATSAHRLEDKLFRNELLRRDLEQGRLGIGWLLTLGDMTRGAWRINLILDALQNRSIPRFLLRRLRRKA